MLLTITTTHRPATDLGYLLGKNPAKVQSFSLNFGTAHVFYPEADESRCTVCLLLDIDPVGLVRRPKGEDAFALGQYTNDRPYVASSFMAVAIGKVFRSALSGKSSERQELADIALPLVANLSCVPVRGGERFLRSLFEPLGYELEVERHELDPEFPEWGDSVYFSVELHGEVRLADLLRHITVLIPVLDDDKHYFVTTDEVDKLLARGEGWLADHPEREQIAHRYLKKRRSLTRMAIERLSDEGEDGLEDEEARAEQEEEALERRVSLNEQRLDLVADVLREHGAKRVLDAGCGEGKLLRKLLRDKQFEHVIGTDVSIRCLERASQRLRLDEMSERQRSRIELFQSSLVYRDERFSKRDAITSIEVVEHLDANRLGAYERVLFEFAAPSLVVLTTPNREYNVRFESLPAGAMRHRDHRFEWTRGEFQEWAKGVADRHGYDVSFRPVGPEDEEVGAPTQMGVFVR